MRPRPKKSRSGSLGGTRPLPLVGPGTPPHRHPPRAATHPARLCHRLVCLATRPSGRRTTLAPETKDATVMLGEGKADQHRQQRGATDGDREHETAALLIAQLTQFLDLEAQ